MNIVCIYGKIVSKIEFKFIIDKKYISIVTFDVELSNKSIVKVIAYDELADVCYSKLEEGDNASIMGQLLSAGTILVDNIVKL